MENKRKRIIKILKILRNFYSIKTWEKKYSPLDILIKTILSQNTSDRNSDRAFENLKEKFPDWDSVLKASDNEIEEAIKIGGLAKVKSKRIKEILNIIKLKNNGKLNLNFLSDYSVEEALNWLLSLKGVGEKTAACTLIFGFNKPVFPVDTHILRITKRLGLIDYNVSLSKAHNLLKDLIPEELYYESHLNLIEHGRKICNAKNPKCSICPINKLCNYYNKNLIMLKLKKNNCNISLTDLYIEFDNKNYFNELINDLINDKLILKDESCKKINCTELGLIYISNKQIDVDTIKKLLEKGYELNLIKKLFNISKNILKSIK